MRLVPVCGDDDELGEAVDLPRGEQLVDGTMERFLAQRGSARIMLGALYVYTVIYCRCSQHAELVREVDGQPAGNEHVGAEGQMRPMLLERTDGYDQSRIAGDVRRDVDPAKLV